MGMQCSAKRLTNYYYYRHLISVDFISYSVCIQVLFIQFHPHPRVLTQIIHKWNLTSWNMETIISFMNVHVLCYSRIRVQKLHVLVYNATICHVGAYPSVQGNSQAVPMHACTLYNVMIVQIKAFTFIHVYFDNGYCARAPQTLYPWRTRTCTCTSRGIHMCTYM